MCGIAGFIGRADHPALERMTRALAHRGPDGEGFWHDAENRVHFGHRRLSIVDLAGGAQPMSTADGELTITFNGEIYNHAELRRELEAAGHRFQTDHSDTEVLLHGWRQWGCEMFGRLNGMWAFALHDRAARRVVLCRDRFGKKPLFHAPLPGGGLAFASELTALGGHPGVDRSVDAAAVRKFLAYGYLPAPHTMWRGARKLPGGCWIEHDLDGGGARAGRWWAFVLEPWESVPRDPEREWGEELRVRLRRAVRRRMVADVPVGVFLSGGVDSSAVAALAAGDPAGGQVHTFSIGFTEASFDEREFARKVAAHIGTVHAEDVLSADRCRELAPAVLARLDEPLGDSSIVPTALLSGFARRSVTVCLGGDGSDELFAGYDPFKALRRADLYRRILPRPVHEGIRLLLARLPVSHANMSLDFRLKRTLRGLSHPPALWCPVWMAPLGPSDWEDAFGGRFDAEEVFSEAIQAWEGCRGPTLVDRTLQFYTDLYLPDDILVKVDRASMMHGLEVRAPFLDPEVVEFARRLPHDWKFRRGRTKHLLKAALAPDLPPEILHRRKQGFGVPIGAWFQQGRLPIPGSSEPWLSDEFVQKRLAAHRAGHADERALLWCALSLNTWLLAQKAPVVAPVPAHA